MEAWTMGLVAPRLHPEPVNHKWNRALTWYLGGAGLRLKLVRARSRKQAPGIFATAGLPSVVHSAKLSSSPTPP